MKDFEYINKKFGTNYKSNSDIDWSNISCKYTLSEEFIEKYKHKLKWKDIFQYQNLSESFIEKQINGSPHVFHYWHQISRFQKLSEAFIEKYFPILNTYFVIEYQKLSETFIEKYIDVLNLRFVSQFQKLSESFIEKHLDKLNDYWLNICQFQKLSESFIEKHMNLINEYYLLNKILVRQILSEEFIEKYTKNTNSWEYVSQYQKLSEKFIEKHQDDVNWEAISRFQKLSEEFIKKHKDKVSWVFISCFQKLSEKFIEDNLDLLDMNYVTIYQKLSDDFVLRYANKLNIYNVNVFQKLMPITVNEINVILSQNNLWQYRDVEFKKEKLIETGKYECYDDYFIAYKAIRADRYSIYNFQYQYLPGETYESTCDCTGNKNSFGLNVGTYEYAKNYSSNMNHLIIKCKVYYKDIGRIVHDGEKVRCFKITILD